MNNIKLFLVVIFLFTFTPIITILFPAQIGTKGVYSFVFYFIFLMFIVFTSKGVFQKNTFKLFFLIFTTWVLINLLKYYIYNEPISSFFNNRTPIVFLIFYLFCLLGFKSVDSNYTTKIRNVILIIAFIQAFFGLIHHFLFSNIIVGENYLSNIGSLPDYLSASSNGTRETGLLLSASLYANNILLGIIVLVYDIYLGNHRKTIEKYLLILFLFFGLLISRSRFPIIFSVLFIFFGLFKNIDLKKSLIIGLISIIIFYIGLGLYQNYFERGYWMSERFLKFELAIKILNQKPLFLLIGVPSISYNETIYSYENQKEIDFSDNSYLSIILTFGLPFLILWGYVLYKQFNFISLNSFITFYLVYVLGCLFITNSIYWDQWILLSMSLLFYFHLRKHAFSTDK